MRLFREMTPAELCDTIHSILAARHAFELQGALASNISEKWVRLQAWADGHVDRLQGELAEACQEYLSRDIPDDDERDTRALAIASAFNWLPSGSGIAVTIMVGRTPGGDA